MSDLGAFQSSLSDEQASTMMLSTAEKMKRGYLWLAADLQKKRLEAEFVERSGGQPPISSALLAELWEEANRHAEDWGQRARPFEPGAFARMTFAEVKVFFESWGVIPSEEMADDVDPTANELSEPCFGKLIAEANAIFGADFGDFCSSVVDATCERFYLEPNTWAALEERFAEAQQTK